MKRRLPILCVLAFMLLVSATCLAESQPFTLECATGGVTIRQEHNGVKEDTHDWLILSVTLTNWDVEPHTIDEALNAVLTYKENYSFSASNEFGVSIIEPLVVLEGALVFRVPNLVASASADDLSLKLFINDSEQNVDLSALFHNDVTVDTSKYYDMATAARDALLTHWRDDVHDANAFPNADGCLTIINTRLILLKDDIAMPDGSSAESAKKLFDTVSYIVEFVLFADYYGSSSYHFEMYTDNTVAIHKDGSMSFPTQNLFNTYRSRTFSSDFSPIIDQCIDLGDVLNGTYSYLSD